MTIQQAIDEIRSQPKWYYQMVDGALVPKNTLVTMAQRIEDGRAKPTTVKKFFDIFGYEVEINQSIKKK